jgi:hypothetical protein
MGGRYTWCQSRGLRAEAVAADLFSRRKCVLSLHSTLLSVSQEGSGWVSETKFTRGESAAGMSWTLAPNSLHRGQSHTLSSKMKYMKYCVEQSQERESAAPPSSQDPGAEIRAGWVSERSMCL